MSSRPGGSTANISITIAGVLALEVCSDLSCLLQFENDIGHLLLEQPVLDLSTLIPTTRQNPANVLVMPPSRPNTSTATTAAQVRNQRSVTDQSQLVIAANDEILNVNITIGTPTCTLPSVASRSGAALTFKDVGGQFFAHNLILTGTGSEPIDGLATYVLANNWAAVTVNPFNDGINSGWFIT